MAQQRLRPGSWKLIYASTSAPITIQIDYEKFEIPPAVSGTRNEVEFDVEQMGLYDDANIIAYRNPVKPLTITKNVGGKDPMPSPYFKKRKY
jgi:hypothetical protein